MTANRQEELIPQFRLKIGVNTAIFKTAIFRVVLARNTSASTAVKSAVWAPIPAKLRKSRRIGARGWDILVLTHEPSRHCP
jgi:hypothetical protein